MPTDLAETFVAMMEQAGFLGAAIVGTTNSSGLIPLTDMDIVPFAFNQAINAQTLFGLAP